MKIHFIGIGGIGVSALAKYYLEKGHKVSGSDLVSSEITEALKKLGAEICIGSHTSRTVLNGIDLVVYSPAVPKDNPELKKAFNLQVSSYKLRVLSYPEALGELTKKYFTIAISGTHGKSTTTAMIGLLLEKAGFNPTVIIGTKLREFNGSNCKVGKSKYLVIEADEHMASFLNYWPKIIVINNIDRDHLDYYKNLNNIIRAFGKFVEHLPKNGILVVNGDDKNSLKLKAKSEKQQFKIKNYSLGQPEIKKLKKILKVPGEHNISNALAALTVARALKIPDKISFKALSEYKGSWRRFEIKYTKLHKSEHKSARITIISDYAHHPTEIKATLKAAREKYPGKKIWCIFQPHQYQRTFYLFDNFVRVFQEANEKNWINQLVITDIYDVAGRENKTIKEKINSKKLIKEIDGNGIYLPKQKIIGYLKKNLKGEGIVIIMGAGDIYKLIYQF